MRTTLNNFKKNNKRLHKCLFFAAFQKCISTWITQWFTIIVKIYICATVAFNMLNTRFGNIDAENPLNYTKNDNRNVYNSDMAKREWGRWLQYHNTMWTATFTIGGIGVMVCVYVYIQCTLYVLHNDTDWLTVRYIVISCNCNGIQFDD